MQTKVISLIAISIWLILISIIMIGSRIVTLEVFFVLWLIGILIIVELSSGRFGQSSSQLAVRWLIGAGIILFIAIVLGKVLVILNT